MKNLFLLFFILCTFGAFSQDGSPDLAFGDNGVVLTNFGEVTLVVSAVNQGESGRIAVLSLEYPIFAITNYIIQVYNEDGTIDTSFGDNGTLRYDNIDGGPLDKITVLNDDSILYGYGGLTFKLLPNGGINTNFGDNGYISIDLSLTDSWGHVIDPNGNIYVYGKKLTGDKEFVIKKFNGNGVVDASFGNQGFVFLDLDLFPVFSENNILFLENGTLLVNYSSKDSSSSDITNYVINIDTSGQIDTSFGTNGYVESFFNGVGNARFHKLYSGNFFISYAADVNGDFLRRVEAYTPNGTLDTSFANGGILSGQSVSFVQQNQRLVTREELPDVNNDFLPSLSRIFSNGALDSSFNFQFNYTALSSPAIAQAADGKIIIAGANNDFPETNLLVLRYNSTPLSVEENSIDSITVFPNPTNDVITISCTECSLTNKRYQITDAIGKYIRQGSFSIENPTISMEGFAAGLYYLTIENTTIKVLKG